MSKAEFHEDTPLAIIGYTGIKNDTGIVLVEDDDTGKYAIIDRFWDVRNYYRVIKIA
jgi:hydrogenase maturation factor